MFLDGCTWSQMRSLYTTTALLKCTPALLVFINETWMCVSNKHRICFLFLLLSPKRGFTTHCVLSACLNLLILTGIKRHLSLFTSDHHIAFGSPTTGWKTFFTFCAREVSLFLGIICAFFPPSTYFHLKFQILFTRVHFVCLSQKNPVSAQTVFLTQCSGLLVIWGLLLLGSPHHTVTGLALGASLITHNSPLPCCPGHGPR